MDVLAIVCMNVYVCMYDNSTISTHEYVQDLMCMYACIELL
jgi:hypothetical protein